MSISIDVVDIAHTTPEELWTKYVSKRRPVSENFVYKLEKVSESGFDSWDFERRRFHAPYGMDSSLHA